MKVKHTLYLFLTSALAVSCCIIFFTIQLENSLSKISQVQERRFHSIQLSSELLQSSNNLTNLARLFVETNDKKFKDYFYQVLNIRSGKAPRPQNYQRAFWDFVLSGETNLLQSSTYKKVSMEKLMEKYNLSSEEIEYLWKAQKLSDKLTQIETQAFQAIEAAPNNGDLTSTEDVPNTGDLAGTKTEANKNSKSQERTLSGHSLAKKLLHNQEYFQAKADIMRPIEAFHQHIDQRTQRELRAVQYEAQLYLILALISTGVLFALLLILFFVVYRKVLLRINSLVNASVKISNGDLQGRSEIVGKDELGTLGRAFDKMVSQLAETLTLLTAAKSNMESELNVAKDIQMGMVPLTFPAYPEHEEFDIFAKLIPAREVGGDFYDFYFVDKDHLCFVVGDVSGKGVPAALMMAVCRTLLKARAQDDFSPASIITHVNNEIAKENPNCMFITIFIGVLNISTGQLSYTNAGHNPTLIKNKGGDVELLSKIHGPVVGIVDDFAYEESHRTLKAADTLFAYTDGVTEAHNHNNEMYSEKKLIQFLKDHKVTSAKEFMEDLYEDVRKFEYGLEPFDDTTALCLKYIKSSEDTPVASKTIQMKSTIKEVTYVIDEFEKFAQEHQILNEILMKINLIFDDILSNIVQYAYADKGEHEKSESTVIIECTLYSKQIIITITDNGVPFNPLLANTPDINLSIDERSIGGLGIHLVKNIVDDCHYRRKVDQNILTLTKKL